jgi:hypothetical protein
MSVVARLRRPRRVWLLIALLAGLAQAAFGYLSIHPHPFESYQEKAARLSQQHGVVIGYGDPSTFFVAPHGPTDGMRVTAAAPENLCAALEGIEEAQAMYPPGFVRGLVSAIFIAGELQFHDARAGGYAGPAWIILAAPESLSKAGIRLNDVTAFHHELSSFVLRKSNSIDAWAAFAPTSWRFASTNEEALFSGAAMAPALDTGFLSAYGATSPENDFNTYAERIFTQPKELVGLACRHPLVRKKLLFVLQTYVALDNRMENTFHGLGIDRARRCQR